MTTAIEALLKNKGEHAVGYFSCIVEPRQIDGGAKCSTDIDNLELVEVYFDATDKEVPYIKPVTDPDTIKGYIVDSSEVLHDARYEDKLNFWNGEGEMANVYVQEAGTTFKTNNFEIASGDASKTPEKGWYAKYVLGASTACPKANGHYELSEAKPSGANVFMVWGTTEDETEELLGLDTVELYVMQ